MLWRDVGYLCAEKTTLDELRKPQKQFTQKEVFCNVKGIKRNEFYQAQAQGIRPELCIEVKECEFENETYFLFRDTMYRILRTYPVKNECIEIICVSMVVDNG